MELHWTSTWSFHF